MHHRLPLLAQKIFNEPLLIHPGKAQVILNVLGDRLGVSQVLAPNVPVSAYSFFDDDDEADYDQPTPYDTMNGIALIPIVGTLVHKNGTVRPYSGMTGYDGIRNAFNLAQTDDNVAAIALHIDSPGGDNSGCFDLVDTIYNASKRGGGNGKPCWAIVDDHAYSAAYAIASAADRIVVPRSGGVGSIGCIIVQTEISGAMSKAGVVANIIQFGAQKSFGNSYEALPQGARDRFQAMVDAAGELFVATVARNRNIASLAVRKTEAACLMPQEALDLGLIDAIMAPEAALSALFTSVSS